MIDFKNFGKEITKYFSDNVQYEKYDLFYDFFFFEQGINKSYLEKKNIDPNAEIEEQKTYALKKDDVKSFYNYAVRGIADDGFKFSGLEDFIKGDFNFKQMYIAGILEKYFIKYSSNYLIMSTTPIDKNRGDWAEYESGRKTIEYLSYFNLYNGLWTFYTKNLGFYYDEIWFAPASDSKIYLEEQKNMFLGYPEYGLQLDDQGIVAKNTTSNYMKPWYYIAILFAISILSFIIALFKFKKYDFK
ncbi:MAG: hypothetical protein C5T88_01205 [Williamsoniiplasma luminosum]|uniref:Uncharacterized protein n=1 Tax=Williamsoniiplasma luminosum TaxID=214888 RepID=A0A2S0NLB4_9MOLU|nr:MAG: hypothetical protein C5T88_01205 [Williamsoniiplasma luminosum]